MERIKVEITHQLNRLRSQTASDFSALANLRESDHVIQWLYVSGNRSDRYKHMLGRPGKGLAGLVVRADRAMVVDETTPDYKQRRLEYPIMLAENLQSALAVPIKVNGKTNGVLLVGSRTVRKFTETDLQVTEEIAQIIASCYDKNKHNISIT